MTTVTTTLPTVKELTCRLLDMTTEAYEKYVFEKGMRYLELRLPGDRASQKVMAYSVYYWTWWGRQFDRRSRILLTDYNFYDLLMVPSELSRKKANSDFDAIHHVSDLNVHLNLFVIRQSFELMKLQQKRIDALNTHEKGITV